MLRTNLGRWVGRSTELRPETAHQFIADPVLTRFLLSNTMFYLCFFGCWNGGCNWLFAFDDPKPKKRTHNMSIKKHVKLGLSALALSVSLGSINTGFAAEDPIKVGILHSLSGTMAISETAL